MSDGLATLVVGIVGAAIGFASAVLAEPLRQWLIRPTLRLSFSNSDDCLSYSPLWIMAETNDGARETVYATTLYLRVKLENISKISAKNCRVILTEVIIEERNISKLPAYVDHIPLKWSCSSPGKETELITLPAHSRQYVDVIMTMPGEESTTLVPCLSTVPMRYEGLFRPNAQTVIALEALADHAKRTKLKLRYKYLPSQVKFEVSSIH